MAKATKTKKEKVAEEPQVAQMAQTPIDSLAEIVESPEIGDEPPSVTLEEVKEVEKEEEKKVEAPEPIKVVEPINTVLDNNLTFEQRINNFLEGKEGFVKANDFLKSLFGIPKFNEPAQWLQQGNSKLLKSTLDGMVANFDITVKDNLHRLLGQPYYPDSTTGKQQHRNLNNVEIYIKK